MTTMKGSLILDTSLTSLTVVLLMPGHYALCMQPEFATELQ